MELTTSKLFARIIMPLNNTPESLPLSYRLESCWSRTHKALTRNMQPSQPLCSPDCLFSPARPASMPSGILRSSVSWRTGTASISKHIKIVS